MKFTECEYKYRADNVALTKFHEFCKNKNPDKYVLASGFDHFYSNPKDTTAFCRHRTGADTNQLTFKRKLNDKNNFVRTEHNIDLSPGMKDEQIAAFCGEFGYKHSRSIYKDAFIYNYEYCTYVYYICYDLDMKELGRFLEIELREDLDWKNQETAIQNLDAIAELFSKELGVTPQMRLKKSLYEMFVA